MMFVYPIGIPSLYWIQLFRYRKRINPDVDTSRLSDAAEVQARKLAKRDADESIHYLCFLFEEHDLPRLYTALLQPILH